MDLKLSRLSFLNCSNSGIRDDVSFSNLGCRSDSGIPTYNPISCSDNIALLEGGGNAIVRGQSSHGRGVLSA